MPLVGATLAEASSPSMTATCIGPSGLAGKLQHRMPSVGEMLSRLGFVLNWVIALFELFAC
eukprot:5708067-Amphidinium_carterae.1